MHEAHGELKTLVLDEPDVMLSEELKEGHGRDARCMWRRKKRDRQR